MRSDDGSETQFNGETSNQGPVLVALGSQLTIAAVRNALSPAVFQRSTRKGVFYFIRDLSLLIGCTIALWLAETWYTVIPLWFLSGYLISALFTIGHDACHGALFENKTLSYVVGQVAMLPSLHPYHQWFTGHNRVHHGYAVKLGGDFVWHPTTIDDWNQMTLKRRLLHRLYWSTVGAPFYYMVEIWMQMFHHTEARKSRNDKATVALFAVVVILSSFGVGGWRDQHLDVLSGVWSVAKMCLIPFLVWNTFIGVTVKVHHINDQVPWKQSEDWTPLYGQMFGTRSYIIPPFLNFFCHNIFIHMPHHVDPRIPFYNLPRALADLKSHYGEYVMEDGSVLGDYLRSCRHCKLFDPAQGRWVGYP